MPPPVLLSFLLMSAPLQIPPGPPPTIHARLRRQEAVVRERRGQVYQAKQALLSAEVQVRRHESKLDENRAALGRDLIQDNGIGRALPGRGRKLRRRDRLRREHRELERLARVAEDHLKEARVELRRALDRRDRLKLQVRASRAKEERDRKAWRREADRRIHALYRSVHGDEETTAPPSVPRSLPAPRLNLDLLRGWKSSPR